MRKFRIGNTYIRFLTAVAISLCLTACGSDNTKAGQDRGNASSKEEPLKIVTTIFPEYDWVMNVLGEESDAAEVTMLLDNGVDMHSYQPTVDDILLIADCDLFIYVGGESDTWVKETLESRENPNRREINLLEVLGDDVRMEESVEGMEAKEDQEEEEGKEADEHVWLSLKNAEIFTGVIADTLSELDPAHAKEYSDNASEYLDKIGTLDADYAEAVSAGRVDTLLFADRFPFRYLVDDYNLEYYAAFAGCSAETEASFETILFLAGKIDELDLPVILTIEGGDVKIAQTVRDNTVRKDQEILTIHSMQSVTAKEIAGGTTYLSVMEENLEVLRDALR